LKQTNFITGGPLAAGGPGQLPPLRPLNSALHAVHYKNWLNQQRRSDCGACERRAHIYGTASKVLWIYRIRNFWTVVSPWKIT